MRNKKSLRGWEAIQIYYCCNSATAHAHRLEITTLKGKVLLYNFLRTIKNLPLGPFFGIYTSMERDPYDTIIEHRGRLYRYDPDYDCFYPVHRAMTVREAWSPVVVILVLAAICYYIEYLR